MSEKSYEEAVLKGISRAKEEMKSSRRVSKVAMPLVASLTVVGLLGMNPNVASALQELAKSFDQFSSTIFGEPTDKYQSLAVPVGQSVTHNGVTMTAQELVYDDNYVMMTLLVESEFLSGFEGRNENDFLHLSYNLFVDHKFAPSSLFTKVKPLSDTSAMVVVGGNIAELEVSDQSLIELKIGTLERGFETVNGKWNFKQQVVKDSTSQTINPNVSVTIGAEEIKVDKVVMSSLGNTIILSSNGAENAIVGADLMVKDSTGAYYYPKSYGRDDCYKLEVSADLSQAEWIEVMPATTERAIYLLKDGISYSLLQTANTPVRANQYDLITRQPSAEEVAAGYGLNHVSYYVNQSDSTPFKPLEQWIGTDISVSEQEVVTIKGVEFIENDAKITFKVPSRYDYHNLSELVLFDTAMKDIARAEGQSISAIENEADGLYSMTLYDVDSQTDYTIAIPLIPELSEEAPAWSLKIPLN